MSDGIKALRMFITNAGPRSVLEIGGDVDMATVDDLHSRLEFLAEFGTGDVDIVMTEVGFCDSSGLHEMMGAYNRLAAAGRCLRIVKTSEQVDRLLALT